VPAVQHRGRLKEILRSVDVKELLRVVDLEQPGAKRGDLLAQWTHLGPP
jgi:hypothetical protein